MRLIKNTSRIKKKIRIKPLPYLNAKAVPAREPKTLQTAKMMPAIHKI